MKKIAVLFLMTLIGFIGVSQVTGNHIFDISTVHTIEISFSEPNFWDTLNYNYDLMYDENDEPTGIKNYMMVDVVIDGEHVDSIGVRQKGYYSNWGAGDSDKKPLKLDFNEFVSGKKYDGLKKLNLNNAFEDPSLMRDVLSYDIMRKMGVVAPRASYANVYLNEEYWGVYIVVEQIDKTFLAENFPSSGGELFKCIDNTRLNWQGNDFNEYKDEFELKTNEEENDWSQFIRLVDNINNTSVFEYEDSINSILNFDSYAKILAADVAILNWDSYYDHGRNFYVYFDPSSKKFEWIPWDYNLSFSDRNTDILFDDVLDWCFFGDCPVFTEKIVNNDSLKKTYMEGFCHVLHNNFTTERLFPKIDSLGELIRPHLVNDNNYFFEMNQFDSSLVMDVVVPPTDPWGWESTYKGLKPFIENRIEQINIELEQEGVDCEALALGEEPVLSHRIKTKLFPNPAKNSVYLLIEESAEINIYNVLGDIVLSKSVNTGLTSLNVESLKRGVYFVQINSERGTESIQLVLE